MKFSKPLLLSLLASASQAPLHAQVVVPPPATTAPPPSEDPNQLDTAAFDDVAAEPEGQEIVVTGSRPRGSVEGDIPPEQSLDARDIRAYGAGNLSELLDALAPQTQSGRGRDGGGPVVLLNGKRISGFSEIRDLPPEAVERVDILPEEVALKYGYRADQKVVNFVLRERFRAFTGEVEAGMATAGGRGTFRTTGNLLKLNEDGRWNAGYEFRHDSPLFESERDILQGSSTGPFSLGGNITAVGGGEIDPALSALVGQPVTVIGVPASLGSGAASLAAFASGANQANSTDIGQYRSLLAQTDLISVNGTVNRTLFGDVSATANARFEASENRNSLGLPSATFLIPADNPYSPFASDVSLYRYFDGAGPIGRQGSSQTGHLGVTLNGDIKPWRWSFTGNFDRASNETRTGADIDPAALQARLAALDPAFNPYGPISDLTFSPQNRAKSVNQSANGELVASGPVVALPAGDVSATVRIGAETRDFESETIRAGLQQRRDLSRDRVNAQGNIDIPIASRRRDVLSSIGDLSLNANAEVEELSDFGTLTVLGGGVNWSPIPAVRVIASFTREEGAPSVQQLGDPVLLNPNVRVFDFVRQETVDVNRIEGGNPALVSDNRRVMKLGLNVRPWAEKDLSLNVNYIRTRINDMIASFPTATPEIEAAFPERFTRDTQGRLQSIDARPVNFEHADTEQLRWGINFSKPIGPQRQPGAGRFRGQGQAAAGGAAQPAPGGAPGTAPEAQGQPAPGAQAGGGQGGRRGGGGGFGGGGGRGFGGGGGGFGGGGGGQGGRLQLSLYHTWRLQDRVLIREGVPELDFLGGSASGSRGGQSRHEVQAQAGVFLNGMGARLSANWQSGTTVNGSTGAAAGSNGDLRFSDLATFNLRLFADLGQQRSLVRNHRWLRGTRVTLSIDNLLDSRQRVTDAAGETPFSYQPYYLDPLGRSIKLGIRKLF